MSGAAGTPWFEDITERSGIRFVHDAGDQGRYLMWEQMGSGGAWLDYDQDGRLDLYLVQAAGTNGAARNQLFHQEPDGSFREAGAGSGLDVQGLGMGVAVADVDNDGRVDVLLTEYGRLRLFRNEGGGRFAELATAGLDNPRWGTSAAFFDYDRDGWLDLVVANYLDYDPTQKCFDGRGVPEFCGPNGFISTVSRLFHNVTGRRPGAGVRFEDVTVPSGFARATGAGLGVWCADFDGDRWPDVFIADDGRPNRLFINRRNGTFTEEAAARGVAYNGMGQTAGNMGVAGGDVDGDGMFDLFVTHLTEEQHVLWRQGPRGFFQDRTAAARLANPAWRGTGFGVALVDLNLDGGPDLVFVNGLVRRGQDPAPRLPGLRPFWSPYAQRHQVFANDGTGRFNDISAANPALTGRASVGRGLLVGDVDNDGAPDVLITGTGGPAQLLRNVSRPRGHWLTIRAVDPRRGGRDAVGAEVLVRAGGRVFWRLVQPGYSYLSSCDPRVSFGLGAATAVEQVEVVWPDGTRERFAGGPVDRLLELRHGQGTAVPAP